MSTDTDPRATANGRGPTDRISRADIEAKFRELEAGFSDRAERAKNGALVVGAVAVGVVVVAAYWFGRRSVRKRRTVLEIRRL
ncbi:MAG TPA: hypothetical protein VFZ83_01155 [Acidimicrobiia bacterium]|nr:hypothetical protein [Acidimicrobiia bacterium]